MTSGAILYQRINLHLSDLITDIAGVGDVRNADVVAYQCPRKGLACAPRHFNPLDGLVT